MAIKLSDHFTYGRLLRFAFPSIVMMVFTSIYGIVDGLFVANFAGKESFAAINLAMPLITALGCFGYMFGTGGAALVAKVLGEGDAVRGNRLFSMIVLFATVCAVIIGIIGYVVLEPFLHGFGASGFLFDEAMLYSSILLLALPFFIVQNTFQSFFIAAEKPKVGLAVTVAAGVTNMVLDFVFIALFDWGVAGAALATLLGQALAAVVPIFYFRISKTSLLKLMKPVIDFRAFGKACANGSSELVTEMAVSVVSALYNLQLMSFAGADGVAAYGIIMYASFVFSAIFFGYAMGVGPVISYHYGAQHHQELHGLLKRSLVMVGVGGVCMLVLSQALAVPFVGLFAGSDQALEDFTVHGFRIYACAFLLSGFNIFGSAFFTALNNGKISAFISFMRTLVFETSTVMILPMFLGVNGIWVAVIVGEAMASIIVVAFMVGMRKTYHY